MSATRQLTASLNITDPDFTQANLGSRGQCTTASFALAAGATCNLSVNFEPLTGGSLSGDATLTDNALNNSPNSQLFSAQRHGHTRVGRQFPHCGGNGLRHRLRDIRRLIDQLQPCQWKHDGVCVAAYSGGTVTLTANPATGSAFSGWGGACAGSSLTCTVNMSASQNVTASFGPGGFGNVNVCTGGNPSGCPGSSQTVTFNFTASTTVNSVQAVTQGASGLDFRIAATPAAARPSLPANPAR